MRNVLFAFLLKMLQRARPRSLLRGVASELHKMEPLPYISKSRLAAAGTFNSDLTTLLG